MRLNACRISRLLPVISICSALQCLVDWNLVISAASVSDLANVRYCLVDV